MEMAHRIRRLQWQVKAERENGFHLRQLVREHWQEQLVEHLQAVLDEFAAADEMVHLPRLSLDIRVPPGDGFTEALAPDLRDQIREQLMAVKKESHTTSIGLEEIAFSRPLAQTQLDFLLTYLRDGMLPWPLADGDSTTIVERCREIVCKHWNAVVQYGVSITYAEEYYYRMFQLIDPETLPDWFDECVSSLPDEQHRTVRHLAAALLDMKATSLTHETLLLLARLVVADRLDWNEGALIKLAQGLPPKARKRWTVLVRRSWVNNAGSSPALNAQSGDHSVSIETTSAGHVQRLAEPSQTSTGSPLPETHQIGQDGTTTGSSLVHLAGLVLLHPYLVRFLAYVGVVDPVKTGIPEDQLPRTVALLHYLATGREEIHEFELGLIKVLLGLTPADTLLIGRGLLSESDKQEADDLLQAVIEHWKALKATSVTGLRQTFLQRSGLLRENEREFTLHVERSGFDVLLEHLPWSYSITRLPWMTKPLSTEW